MTVDASKAPQKQKRDFVGLAVRRAAPFADAGFDVAWAADGRASVWYWSRERVSQLLGEQPAKRVVYVAEALYVGAQESDGTQLLALTSGVEGRIWKKDHLVASRWWASEPVLAEWLLFLRSAGVACTGATGIPETIDTTVSSRPWSRAMSATNTFRLTGLEQYLPRAAFAAGLIFVFVSLAQAGGILRARADIWQARAASADLDASLKRILAARENADAELDKIDALLALREGQSQTRLLANAVDLMPQGEWQLRVWNQTAPDLIEVTIISPNANPEQIVAAWEASPLFTNVTTELGRDDEVTIKAAIVPANPETGPDGA